MRSPASSAAGSPGVTSTKSPEPKPKRLRLEAGTAIALTLARFFFTAGLVLVTLWSFVLWGNEASPLGELLPVAAGSGVLWLIFAVLHLALLKRLVRLRRGDDSQVGLLDSLSTVEARRLDEEDEDDARSDS